MSLVGSLRDGSLVNRVYLHDRSPRIPGGPTVLAGPIPVFARGLAASDDSVGVRVRSWAHDEQGVCSYRVERSIADGPFEEVPAPDPTLWLAKSSIPIGAVGRFRLEATDCACGPGTPHIGPPERPTMMQEDGAGGAASAAWPGATGPA